MGKLAEAEQVTKPGTANVSPSDRKKLSGLLKHYGKMKHPFSRCVKDQIKHGLTKDRANRRCAVIKDLIRGTTKWRGKNKEENAIARKLAGEAWELLEAARDLLGPNMVAMIAVTEHDVAGVDDELAEALANAAKIVEAVPKWMLPRQARKSGFKPTDPEKSKAPADADFEKKHKRGEKGTEKGGQFVRKGGTGELGKAVASAMPGTSSSTFDEAARRATIAFQRRNDIQVDGVVGHQTVVAMRGGDASKVKPGPLTAADRKWLRKQLKGNS